VNGQRFREGLDTTDWREARSRQKELITQATQGKLAPSSQQFARLAFSEAADRYLESRKLELSPRSLKKERQLLVHPRRFWGGTLLNRINTESLRAYRESRGRAGLRASYLNMEFGAITRILKRARRRHSIAEDIKPLRERGQVGRALSPEEKSILLKRTDNRPEWQTIRCAAILALPLNPTAMYVILELHKRAQLLNATDLDRHVFPACENGRIEPIRPRGSCRTAWRH
jgi:hypothetical protein